MYKFLLKLKNLKSENDEFLRQKVVKRQNEMKTIFQIKIYKKKLFYNFRLDHFIRDEKIINIKWAALKLSNVFLDG
jgi:hypothetical protein